MKGNSLYNKKIKFCSHSWSSRTQFGTCSLKKNMNHVKHSFIENYITLTVINEQQLKTINNGVYLWRCCRDFAKIKNDEVLITKGRTVVIQNRSFNWKTKIMTAAGLISTQKYICGTTFRDVPPVAPAVFASIGNAGVATFYDRHFSTCWRLEMVRELITTLTVVLEESLRTLNVIMEMSLLAMRSSNWSGLIVKEEHKQASTSGKVWRAKKAPNVLWSENPLNGLTCQVCECPLSLVRSQMLWNKIAFLRKSDIRLPGTRSLHASWTWPVADRGKHLYCAVHWLKNGRNHGCLLANSKHTISAASDWKIPFAAKCWALGAICSEKCVMFLFIDETFFCLWNIRFFF